MRIGAANQIRWQRRFQRKIAGKQEVGSAAGRRCRAQRPHAHCQRGAVL